MLWQSRSPSATFLRAHTQVHCRCRHPTGSKKTVSLVESSLNLYPWLPCCSPHLALEGQKGTHPTLPNQQWLLKIPSLFSSAIFCSYRLGWWLSLAKVGHFLRGLGGSIQPNCREHLAISFFGIRSTLHHCALSFGSKLSIHWLKEIPT